LASLSHAHASVAEPVTRPRLRTGSRTGTRRKQARARGGILWITVSGILLAGVVFVNVAVLRLNIGLDSANSERAKLRAENAGLESELSRQLRSGRIESQALRQFGVTYQDPALYGHIDLTK
jgi:hypothetical protein